MAELEPKVIELEDALNPDISDEEFVEPFIITTQDLETKIAEYEAMFGMTSEEFWAARKAGHDFYSFEASDWASMLRFVRGW